jgi:deazaflavin-dependent oxidoreductase (nitroreductase family)
MLAGLGRLGQTVTMNPLASVARRLGGQRWFAVVGRAYVPVDRLLGRLSKGRFVALGLRDLPSLLLTTTGRRSGEPRTTPLLYVLDTDAFVVAGSNWGQSHQPAWSGNLLAHPHAVVTVAGKKIPVRAHLAHGAERERLWQLMRGMWPAYDAYQKRAAGRDIRVFRLERVGGERAAQPDRDNERRAPSPRTDQP